MTRSLLVDYSSEVTDVVDYSYYANTGASRLLLLCLTQALLDYFTITDETKDLDLPELTITLVGDLKYGRTVHSLSRLLALSDVSAALFYSLIFSYRIFSLLLPLLLSSLTVSFFFSYCLTSFLISCHLFSSLTILSRLLSSLLLHYLLSSRTISSLFSLGSIRRLSLLTAAVN